MFSRREFSRHQRELAESEITRIEQELRVTLPDAYKQALRDNPLSHGRNEVPSDAFCMDAQEIITTNLRCRQNGWYGLDWPDDLLWVGDGGHYPFCHFLRLNPPDDQVYFFRPDEKGDLHDPEPWKAAEHLDAFFSSLVSGHTEHRRPIVALLWDRVLGAALAVRLWRYKRQRAKRQQTIKKMLNAPSTPLTSAQLDGAFSFVATVPLSLWRHLTISNRWTFYPDGTLTYAGSASGGGAAVEERKFGSYTIRGNSVVAEVGPDHLETRLVIIDGDTLVQDGGENIYTRESPPECRKRASDLRL